jgi:hypothetical protein
MADELCGHGNIDHECPTCLEQMREREKRHVSRMVDAGCKISFKDGELVIRNVRAETAESRVSTLEAERRLELATGMAVLCGNHAQVWYTARNTLKPKSGCVFCDAKAELARKELELENEKLKKKVHIQ